MENSIDFITLYHGLMLALIIMTNKIRQSILLIAFVVCIVITYAHMNHTMRYTTTFVATFWMIYELYFKGINK